VITQLANFKIGVITPCKHCYLVITLAIRQRTYTVIII